MSMPEIDKAVARLLNSIHLPTAIFLSFFLGLGYLAYRDPTGLKRIFDAFETDNWNNWPPKDTRPSQPTFKPSPPLKASDHQNDNKHHLLLASTGSVATIKLPNIIQTLSHQKNLSIRIILTKSATSFLQGQSPENPTLSTISSLPNVDGIYLDQDEWSHPWTRGAPILHIELRRWADIMLIAPLSANSLAKLSLGMSDNLVSSVARAWDTTGLIDKARPGIALPDGRKRVLVAPAMNTAMWNHPVTQRHMDVLEKEWKEWVEVLRPIEKDLACGDLGGGAMMEWKDIVSIAEERLGLKKHPEEEEGYVDVERKKEV